MKKTKKLSRRTVLRGLGGATVALPFLEAMTTSGSKVSAADGDIPKRYLVCVAGSSLGAGSVSIDETYVPSTVGMDYDLKRALVPLGGGMLGSGTRYASVKDEVSVVTNLKIPWAAENGGRSPAGGRPDNHHETMVGPLLTGVRTPDGKNGSAAWGPSSDQVILDTIGEGSLAPSLQYCAQLSSYLGGGGLTNRSQISFTGDIDLSRTASPIRPQNSPRAAWEELFFNFQAGDTEARRRQELELITRRSILDVVNSQSRRLKSKLGRPDQIRLERHFSEIRDMEMRLSNLAPDVEGACMALADPGADPSSLGNRQGDGYDRNVGYSNEELRADIFNRLIHMAFACDLTRSISFMYTHFHSWMNVYEICGRESDQHELGHSRHGSEGQADMLAWHYKHFASLIDSLRNTEEVDGSRLLDHCALVMTHEGGYGLDPADNAERRSHSTENMACLIAGGGLRHGQHIRTDEAHPAQVLLSGMRAVGYESDTLGEVSGVIPELFA